MRVVIADDSVLLREGLARVLMDNGFEVVAQVGDAEALERAVRNEKPDVAIVDVRMPPTHTDEGTQAAVRIRAAHPEVGVLVLSQVVEARHALTLFRDSPEGFGYLLKGRVVRARGVPVGCPPRSERRHGRRPRRGRAASRPAP